MASAGPLLLVSSGSTVFHAALRHPAAPQEEATIEADIAPFEDQDSFSFAPAKIVLGLGERTWIIDKKAFLHSKVLGVSAVTVEDECFEVSDGGRCEDAHGRTYADMQHIPVPSMRWSWSGEWAADRQPAMAPETRRRFVRRRSFTPTSNPYTRVPAPMDEALQAAACTSDGSLWVLTASNKVYQRIRGRMCEPEGVAWLPAPPLPGQPASAFNSQCGSLALPPRGGMWALDGSGGLHYWSTVAGSNWLSVDGLFKAVCCPGTAVWALTADDEVVCRLGVTSDCPTGRAWLPVPSPVLGRALEPFMLALNESQIVVLDSAGQLHMRTGLSSDCDLGRRWLRVVLPDDRPVRWLAAPPQSQAEIDEIDASSPVPTQSLHRAVVRARVAECVAMLEDGAEVDARDALRRTPLHLALLCGSTVCVNLFLSNRADVDACDANRMTPLHFAALCMGSSTESLLERDANVLPRDVHGNTPLHYAAWTNNVAVCESLLARCPALVFARNNDLQTPFAVADKRGNGAVLDLLAKTIAAWSPAVAMPTSGHIRVLAHPRLGLPLAPPSSASPATSPIRPQSQSMLPPPPPPTSPPPRPQSLPLPLGAGPSEGGPALPLPAFALLERRQLLLYQAGTVDQRLGVLPLPPGVRLVPTTASIAIFNGDAWQLTIVLSGFTEVARWMRGLLHEIHAIAPTTYAADPTCLTNVTLPASTTAAAGLTGTCDYQGLRSNIRVFSPDATVPWDIGLLTCAPTPVLVKPLAVGQCIDFSALQRLEGAKMLQFAITSLLSAGAVEAPPLLEVVVEPQHRACVLRQLCQLVFCLASVGVDFADVPVDGIRLRVDTHSLAVSNITEHVQQRAQSPRAFGPFLTALLTRWSPPASSISAEVSDTGADLHAAGAAVAAPSLSDVGGAANEDGATTACVSTRESVAFVHEPLLALVADLAGGPATLLDTMPRLAALLPDGHRCELCAPSEAIVHF